MEKKYEQLLKEFDNEMNEYRLLEEKLKKEQIYIKENNIDDLFKNIKEKEEILTKIEEIENKLSDIKNDYLTKKILNNFSIKEIDNYLLKLNKKIEKLILLQAENARIMNLLLLNIKDEIKKIDNVNKYLNENKNELSYIDTEL